MAPTSKNAPFLLACGREKAPFTPIWLLRQAGRYMKEYREVREKVGFLELCKTPDLACEVTVTAREKIGADAAIIFSDILLITEPLGFHLEFTKGEGPSISNAYTDERHFDSTSPFDPKEHLGFVLDAISLTRKALPAEIPLIGFAGAPFTVASYVIEGGKSRTFEKTKSVMRDHPKAWETLLGRISTATAAYLNAQIKAGADAVQLFDSWIGALTVEEYRDHVSQHTERIFTAISPNTPAIHFGTNNSHLLPSMKAAGGTVIGLDYRVDLAETWEELGDVAVQGNLDPNLLLLDRTTIRKEALKILKQASGRPGHVFNVGHGVLPGTPVDNVRFLIDFVHEESTR
jgi:uroporphyrinogen decarboxylase